VYWIAFALAGGSLILSAATLYVVLGVRRSTRRAERAGNERLEILREQQESLAFLHEERRMLDEELKWRRSIMDGEESLVALEAASGSNGYPIHEQPKAPRSWLRRIIGRIGSISR
jgi:hypothetical protein